MFNKAAAQIALRARAAESRIVGLARAQVQGFQQARAAVQVERAAVQAASSRAVASIASVVLADTVKKRAPGKWWGTQCEAHIKFHDKREKKEEKALTIRDRDEVYMDADASNGCAGDLRLNKLNYWLNGLGVQRSPDQQLFHKHFTCAVLPKIYGTQEWNQEGVRVMRSLNIKRIRYEVTAITRQTITMQCNAKDKQ